MNNYEYTILREENIMKKLIITLVCVVFLLTFYLVLRNSNNSNNDKNDSELTKVKVADTTITSRTLQFIILTFKTI